MFCRVPGHEWLESRTMSFPRVWPPPINQRTKGRSVVTTLGAIPPSMFGLLCAASTRSVKTALLLVPNARGSGFEFQTPDGVGRDRSSQGSIDSGDPRRPGGVVRDSVALAPTCRPSTAASATAAKAASHFPTPRTEGGKARSTEATRRKHRITFV